MKYFKLLIFFQLILFLYSCSTVKQGFTNQKKSSSDEFLVEKKSPLKLGLESGQQLEGMEPQLGDIVVEKSVNSGFIGTSLELELRRAGIQRLVVVGFFTNICVETTVRMSGNMGFDTYLVHDSCATMNSIGHDGTDYDPDLVHNMAIASLHGEFCTANTTKDALYLCTQNANYLNREQGNE